MIIAKRYLVVEEIGRGGMGAVFRCQHEVLGREIALKVLLPHVVGSKKAEERFMREAQVAALFRHPNAVEIYDFGRDRGLSYMAMPLLKGEELGSVIQRERGLYVPRMIRLGWQLADALVAAHKQRIIHRDLKPENIIVERSQNGEEQPMILDFGLAHIIDHQVLGRMTTEGRIIGSPAYMSPEQLYGDMQISTASDLYSLGCVFYEMLCGAPPFEGSIFQIASKHVGLVPPLPSERGAELPSALEDLVMRMLRKAAPQRPSASDVRAVLVQLQIEKAGECERGQKLGRETQMLTASKHGFHKLLKPKPAPGQLRLALLGELEAALSTGLRSNGISVEPLEEGIGEAQAVLVAQEELLEQGLKSGLPVIAAIKPGDVQLIAELLRAGIAEVLPLPLKLEDLLRASRRTIRRAQRRGGS